ncbi:MAG: hypothetical protein U0840_05365 [Gemmataceae bacterium]
MRYPQLIVFESDGRLAAQLAPLSTLRGWPLREPHRAESVLSLLETDNPSVVVIRCGRDLERELSLLERVSLEAPAACSILVVDQAHPRLYSLGWQLGASFLLSPRQARDHLIDLVDAHLNITR